MPTQLTVAVLTNIECREAHLAWASQLYQFHWVDRVSGTDCVELIFGLIVQKCGISPSAALLRSVLHNIFQLRADKTRTSLNFSIPDSINGAAHMHGGPPATLESWNDAFALNFQNPKWQPGKAGKESTCKCIGMTDATGIKKMLTPGGFEKAANCLHKNAKLSIKVDQQSGPVMLKQYDQQLATKLT
ncbi:hypothetical protein WJX74_006863 [Apatococcus lobatus]|uniref:Uncharacterized protein n=1 Tax=Apatococcus lobatus TaxID=904363 RepID=A0AAW1QLR0_9CHLO